MKGIVSRIKALEAVQKKVDDVAIVDDYLALIELSIAGEVIFEIPDFREFRLSQIESRC